MLRSFALFALVAFVLGCDSGPTIYEVSGEVSFKDKPVKLGVISFRSDDGSTGAAQVVDGKYVMPPEAGLLAGKYRVAISYPDPKIPQPSSDELPGETPPNREMLPKKYNSETQLTAEVKPDSKVQVISFKLD